MVTDSVEIDKDRLEEFKISFFLAAGVCGGVGGVFSRAALLKL